MSLIDKITTYLKGANEELRKVAWPNKQETIRSTTVVIFMSLAVAAFFWILDQLFSYIFTIVTK